MAKWRPLKALVFAVALALGSNVAHAENVATWTTFIAEASQRFGIPVDWIGRVMRAESGGRTVIDGRPTISSAGAMGLMQLMPATWKDMRASLGLGPDPHDPRDNILAGTAYLRLMYDRFGYPGLFAAYNAGPGRYAEHLTIARALPGETRAYVAAITGALIPRVGASPVAARAATPRTASLFFALSAPKSPRVDQ